ncbi:hypothetical protein CEXT_346441, partial [Caerostris extrusa]
VVVERASNERVLLNLDTDKFLVPENISYFHFAALIRSRSNIRNPQPFYISVNKMCLKSIFNGAQGDQLMGDMYTCMMTMGMGFCILCTLQVDHGFVQSLHVLL